MAEVLRNIFFNKLSSIGVVISPTSSQEAGETQPHILSAITHVQAIYCGGNERPI
jgi:hypothetical protein